MSSDKNEKIVIGQDDLEKASDQPTRPPFFRVNLSPPSADHTHRPIHSAPPVKGGPSPSVYVIASACILAVVVIGSSLLWSLTATPNGPGPVPSGTKVDPVAASIERVLVNDKELISQTMSLPSDATPSDRVQAIANYRSRADGQDFSDCPADFVVAYRQYVRSWEDVQDAISEVPGDYFSLFVTAFINGAQGELDGGMRRMKAEVKNACSKMRSKQEAVESLAANKYGAASR